MPKVFVYGTLKAGYRNHHVLGSKAKIIGTFKTAPHFRLYDNGSYPCMIQVTGDDGLAIEGEVYEVPEAQMSSLDRLEGVPWLYQRATLAIDGIDGPVLCYLYQQSVSDFADCGPSWPRTKKKAG